jgi:hypothetical protein
LQLPLNASDELLYRNMEAISLFETRCVDGHFDLIKAAYDQLPAQLQDDPHILFQMASCGGHGISDVLVPIQRWNKRDPDEPCPYLLLVDFYWRLYNGPRVILTGPNKGTKVEKVWTPEEEDGVRAAIEKANGWFDDPAMEVRLAHYFATKQPAKSRPLLLQAIRRSPPLGQAFSELIHLDISQRNFAGIADTLHLGEVAFQTNFTAMVNESMKLSEFKKSPEFRKWQHDYHPDHAAASTAAK